MYCYKEEGKKFLHTYTCFFPHPKTVELNRLGFPIIAVDVVEAPDDARDEDCYWGWWENKDQQYWFVFAWRGGVDMCFTYGSDAEEKRGRGKVLRVLVKEIGPADMQMT